jgi:transglutaminase-like putative cysteine protease
VTVSAASALRISRYLLVYDGLAALYAADLIAAPTALLVVAAVAASWWQERFRERLTVSPVIGRIGSCLVVTLAGLDLAYLAESFLEALPRLLLLALLFRLFARRARRDARDVAFLSFLMLVAASAVSFGVALIVIFVVFLAVITWTLMLQHQLWEADRAGRTVDAEMGSGLLALSLVASLTTLVITAGLFFVIPRIGQAALVRSSGRMVIGFTDRVELGSIGQLESDATIVMRVHLPQGVPAARRAKLRWRGVALEHFDGLLWTAAPRRPLASPVSGAGLFEIDAIHGTGPLLRQEVALESVGSDVIFAAPRIVRGTFRSDTISVDQAGTVSVSTASARARYVVESELESESPAPRAAGGGGDLDLAALDRYLQLPRLPGRIETLARQVTAGSRDAAESARRLSEFLSGPDFRYTLALERHTDLAPLDEFLFVRRSGNCEYFAAALAVMLRTLGIPARVVNGFQRGEWNPYGSYFMVRLLDAHAWVEAHVGRAGWVTFDPSPRAEREAPALGQVALYADALRSRWLQYIATWSLQDQVLAAVGIRQSAWVEQLWRLGSGGTGKLPPRVTLAAVLAAAIIALLVGVGRARGGRAAAAIPRFYQEAMRALARGGLRPGPDETAREFCRRVTGETPGVAPALERITAQYERVRFGAGALSAAEATELEARVRELRASLRRRARCS